MALLLALILGPLVSALNPYKAEWDNSVAICAIMRQERTEDLREWLQYHRHGLSSHAHGTGCSTVTVHHSAVITTEHVPVKCTAYNDGIVHPVPRHSMATSLRRAHCESWLHSMTAPWV